MSNDQAPAAEAEIIDALRHEIGSVASLLGLAGLTAELKDVKRTGTGVSYESEVAVWILRNSVLVDTLHYRIFANGKQRLNAREAVGDVRREVAKLADRA